MSAWLFFYFSNNWRTRKGGALSRKEQFQSIVNDWCVSWTVWVLLRNKKTKIAINSHKRPHFLQKERICVHFKFDFYKKNYYNHYSLRPKLYVVLGKNICPKLYYVALQYQWHINAIFPIITLTIYYSLFFQSFIYLSHIIY